MGSQHGKLNVEGRVEHGVRTLLMREYPFVFCFTDVLPLTDGLTGRVGSFVIVTDDTAQQSVVANGNPVMVIQRDTGQRRDVDFVLQRVVNLLGQ